VDDIKRDISLLVYWNTGQLWAYVFYPFIAFNLIFPLLIYFGYRRQNCLFIIPSLIFQ